MAGSTVGLSPAARIAMDYLLLVAIKSTGKPRISYSEAIVEVAEILHNELKDDVTDVRQVVAAT